MNEEILIGKLNKYIIPKIKEHSNKGRPYSINNEELIEAFFLCSKVWNNLETSIKTGIR